MIKFNKKFCFSFYVVFPKVYIKQVDSLKLILEQFKEKKLTYIFSINNSIYNTVTKFSTSD